jgi:hypothetical protein
MVNDMFAVTEGKFRLPMIRGEHSPAIQHYKHMEQIIASDLNSWLCNIYVEVITIILEYYSVNELLDCIGETSPSFTGICRSSSK